MTTHDYNIANQTFPAFRADLNGVLSAILSNNSSASPPSTTTAGMIWYDTANGILKQRNAADSGWIHLWTFGAQGLVDQSGASIYAADAGSTDSYAITLTPAPSAYAVGQVFRFKANTANTGAASLNVNGLGAVTIKKSFNSDLSTGDILANQFIEVIYDGTNFQLLSITASASSVDFPRGHLAGLALSNNGSDANNDLDIAVGACRDSTNATNLLLALGLTKRSDAAWAVGSGSGGMDTGTKPNNGTLHVWLIKRSDTGVVDALFSISATTPTMPANYDFKRRLGACITDGSGNIIAFTQDGDDFLLKSPILDINATDSTTATTRTISVPDGIKVKALLNAYTINGSGGVAGTYFSSPDVNDDAPSLSANVIPTIGFDNGTGNRSAGGQVEVRTNTSSQIRTRSVASLTLRVSTVGWQDRRGKDS